MQMFEMSQLLTYFMAVSVLVQILRLIIAKWCPLRGKRDGVIGHISKCENGNCMEKLQYCVIDQSVIQRDWANFLYTQIVSLLCKRLM